MERSGESQLALGVRGDFEFPPESIVSAVAAITAGAALRLWMLHALFEVSGDSLVYGGIAKNLLLRGQYALTTGSGITYPTLIRLPGYPLFLAACFRLFGMENYFAVGCIQIVVELATCLLLAAFALQIARSVRRSDAAFGRRAGLATLWLAALCPFTASYAVRPLSETLTLFALALALFAMGKFSARPGWSSALVFTFAVTYATLLRPDGALAAIAFAPTMLIAWKSAKAHRARMPLVCLILALAPFAAWGWRNWSVFHVFQPLAPRMATDPDERTNPGWERWIKTWCLGYSCTEQVYWQIPDGTLNLSDLPQRAFDSQVQYAETLALANDYNAHGKKLTDALDTGFARLADERIAAHPLRFYLWLPVGRVLDMWLRPRNENLFMALDWWNYARHRGETIFSWFYITLNAAFLLLALAGLWMRPRFWMPLLAYIVMRCCLLLTIAAPEARYTIECFPMLFVWGGVALALMLRRASGSSSAKPNLQPV
jgi:hypothetical protein